MPTIKENLLRAIEIIDTVPDSAINLAEYVHPCGTMFCLAGVLAQHAFFVDQLHLPRGALQNKAASIAVSPVMWGPEAFNRLFAPRRHYQDDYEGTHDEELLAQHGEMSDKQLALARLFHALKAEK